MTDMKKMNKYIPKANIVRYLIENYDPEQRKVKFEQFMKKTHNELLKDIVRFGLFFGSPRSINQLFPDNKRVTSYCNFALHALKSLQQ